MLRYRYTNRSKQLKVYSYVFISSEYFPNRWSLKCRARRRTWRPPSRSGGRSATEFTWRVRKCEYLNTDTNSNQIKIQIQKQIQIQRVERKVYLERKRSQILQSLLFLRLNFKTHLRQGQFCFSGLRSRR